MKKPEECTTVRDVIEYLLEEVKKQGGPEVFMEHYPEKDCMAFAHRTLGMQIRNTFNLWDEKSNGMKIREDCVLNYKDSDGDPIVNIPDSVSTVIMEELWKAVVVQS
tara:strand:- start:4005 stop:4325 length:321 start_codon:yes stop_codon:yes gene_type:complete